MTTNTLWVGWEAGLINGGANLVVNIVNPIIITGYEITLSLGYNTAGVSGFTEVMAQGAIISGTPTGTAAPAVPAAPGPCYIGPSQGFNSDISGGPVVDPNKFFSGGNVFGWPGLIFAAIMKTEAPQGENEVLLLNGIRIPANAGDTLVIHADAAGAAIDFEIQGCIYYEYPTPAA